MFNQAAQRLTMNTNRLCYIWSSESAQGIPCLQVCHALAGHLERPVCLECGSERQVGQWRTRERALLALPFSRFPAHLPPLTFKAA